MERNSQLTHGSLFSGIGGIELGLEWAGFKTTWQVEIDDFCNQVLAKRWPNVPKFLDVKSVGKHNLTPVNLISGGFPCQDLSVGAGGKERGLFERSGLWFEYARIIREIRPDWVLVENVPNLKTHGADIVLSDLEGADYSCWASVVGCDSFQAPFKRHRVFILAHNNADSLGSLGEIVGWPRFYQNSKGRWRKCAKTGRDGSMNWLQEMLVRAVVQRNPKLMPTPEVCESFMGFPIGHTDLKR